MASRGSDQQAHACQMELIRQNPAIYLYASATVLHLGAGTAELSCLGIHSLTGDAVNTFVSLEQLNNTDLREFYEVWLTTSETWPQDPSTAERRCLWRADRELTQDVEIDDACFQNLPRLWLLVDDLNDAEAVNVVEHALTTRLGELKAHGELHPGETHKVAASDDKRTDLRS